MHIPHILYLKRLHLKRKKGAATVFGTIIFIGILFTTVIPMYLVMKQADSIYDKKKFEMVVKDEERAREEVVVYAYPLGSSSNQFAIEVNNMGATPITVARVWINDVYFSQNTTVSGTETRILGPLVVTLQNNCSYQAKLTTERGNVFPSGSGPFYYSDGTWFTYALGISVNIANTQGKYHIRVSNSTWSSEYLSQATEFGDVIRWFDVDTPGSYLVIVEKYLGGNKYKTCPGTPMTAVIKWPAGTPIVYVYTSGIGL